MTHRLTLAATLFAVITGSSIAVAASVQPTFATVKAAPVTVELQRVVITGKRIGS